MARTTVVFSLYATQDFSQVLTRKCGSLLEQTIDWSDGSFQLSCMQTCQAECGLWPHLVGFSAIYPRTNTVWVQGHVCVVDRLSAKQLELSGYCITPSVDLVHTDVFACKLDSYICETFSGVESVCLDTSEFLSDSVNSSDKSLHKFRRYMSQGFYSVDSIRGYAGIICRQQSLKVIPVLEGKYPAKGPLFEEVEKRFISCSYSPIPSTVIHL
jgi:hypothetical protein